MKRIYWFSIAAALTSALLITVAAAGLYFFSISGILSTFEPRNSVSNNISLTEPPENQRSTRLLVVFSEGEKLYSCILNLDFRTKTVGTSAIDLTAIFQENPSVALQNEGTYCFVERCFNSVGESNGKFIIINSEKFIKIADKCHGIVYNHSDKDSMLLTGNQAEEIISYDTLPDICRQLGEFALKGNETELFSFLVSNTENNLSYPHIYDLIH